MMIYFLSTLLVLQLAVVVWLVWKNMSTTNQSKLLNLIQEIDVLKKEVMRNEADIKQTHEEIMAERECLQDIHTKIDYQQIKISHKMKLLDKIYPSYIDTYFERRRRA